VSSASQNFALSSCLKPSRYMRKAYQQHNIPPSFMKFVQRIHKLFLQGKGITKNVTLGCPYCLKQPSGLQQKTNNPKFYIRGTVHHNSTLKKSNDIQQYADIYLPLNYSTCFGRPSRPSSGVHKTVDAAFGTDHNNHNIRGSSSPDIMICNKSCNYSFMYS